MIGYRNEALRNSEVRDNGKKGNAMVKRLGPISVNRLHIKLASKRCFFEYNTAPFSN